MYSLAKSHRYIIAIASFFLILAFAVFRGCMDSSQNAEVRALFDVVDAKQNTIESIEQMVQDNETLSASQKKFVLDLWPAIQAENIELLKRRELIKHWKANGFATEEDKAQFETFIEDYRVKGRTLKEQFTLLLRKVDVIPASLAISQAAIESAWGNSRFAKEGKNYFGVWCYTLGCGIAPLQRAAGQTHEVKKYDSLHDGVSDYMLNLNRNGVYRKLVTARHEARNQGYKPRGSEMAVGLKRYSALGSKYISMVRSVIRKYHLEKLPSY